MPGSRSPGFSPPVWPRLGRRRSFVALIFDRADDPVRIPYEWINPPLVRRPTTAITKAQISQTGGSTAYSSAAAATVSQYGVNATSIDLPTACDADPQNLADFLTTYQAVPRPRQPTIRFNLLRRTDDECLTILQVELAQRVVITGAPDTWPAGARSFVVEGIRHTIAVDNRIVEWMTSAPIGATAGTPGPWVRMDGSYFDGTDAVPF